MVVCRCGEGEEVVDGAAENAERPCRGAGEAASEEEEVSKK